MNRRIPNHHEIKTPNLDYLTAAQVGIIRQLTGLDPFSVHISEGTALLGWWAAIKLPEWQGIEWEEVRDTWPLGVFNLQQMDDDADDVLQAAADLPASEADADQAAGEPNVPFTAASEPVSD